MEKRLTNSANSQNIKLLSLPFYGLTVNANSPDWLTEVHSEFSLDKARALVYIFRLKKL